MRNCKALALFGLACLLLATSEVSAVLEAEQCADKATELEPKVFASKTFACRRAGADKDSCCEEMKSLYDFYGTLDGCMCRAEFYTMVVDSLPIEGITADDFVVDLEDCGIPVKGSDACGGGEEGPQVKAQLLVGMLLAKRLAVKSGLAAGAAAAGFATGALLGGGGGAYYYGGYGDDDDDDDDGRPVPIPPYSPPPSPSPTPSPSPGNATAPTANTTAAVPPANTTAPVAPPTPAPPPPMTPTEPKVTGVAVTPPVTASSAPVETAASVPVPGPFPPPAPAPVPAPVPAPAEAAQEVPGAFSTVMLEPVYAPATIGPDGCQMVTQTPDGIVMLESGVDCITYVG